MGLAGLPFLDAALGIGGLDQPPSPTNLFTDSIALAYGLICLALLG